MRLCQMWLGLTLLASLGCGASLKEPDLGTVKGKVTVDGQPGANLMVTFEPQSVDGATKKDALQVGGGSTGITDAGGNYELSYKGGSTKGAAVGNHLVRITSASGGGPAGGEKGAVPVVIPPKYNQESKLTQTVKKGENTINLEITSK